MILVYDIFGNLISEYYPDGTNVRDWIYLGNNRLAMIMTPNIPSWHGFPGCQAPMLGLLISPGVEYGAMQLGDGLWDNNRG
jgi:hypothetical protein